MYFNENKKNPFKKKRKENHITFPWEMNQNKMGNELPAHLIIICMNYMYSIAMYYNANKQALTDITNSSS